MKAFLVLLAIFAIANAANVGIAHITGTTLDSGITGTAYFVQLNDTYHWVWVSVTGIKENADLGHAIHVHTWGDLTDQAAGNSAGGHYGGIGGTTHGCEDTDTRHEGDMGTWQATAGTITGSKTLNLLATTGEYSIIGRAIVVHNLTDTCTAQPTGAAGNRLAFGVIGISNPSLWPQAVLDALNATTRPTANGAVSGAVGAARAVVVLSPTTNNATYASLTGTITFEQDATSGDVTVTGVFQGLIAGYGFGLHIHQFADWSANASAVGNHFGFPDVAHGGPNNNTRHYGDLGNICSFNGSTAYYRWVMTDDKFTLSGANSILGRGVVVHAVYDTMRPDTNYGTRIAQGVIGLANATNPAIITIPAGFNVSDPICASVTPSTPTTSTTTTTAATTTTNAATTRPATSTTTTGASSSASFVAVCFTAVIALFAVVLF